MGIIVVIKLLEINKNKCISKCIYFYSYIQDMNNI